MKKFIIAVALFATSSFAFAGPTFGHWTVNNKSNMISNGVLGKDGYHTIAIHDNATVALSYSPNGSENLEMGKVINSNKVILQVNGKNVNFLAEEHESGFIYLTTVSTEGDKFVISQLWSKRNVKFIIKGNESFWIDYSAQGVQKAWRYMAYNSAI
ncbi:MAG: hypothetical protein ACRCUJ_14870 [Phocaeicola sp.]